MGNLFGGPKKSKSSSTPSKNNNKENEISDQDRAILELKRQRDRLTKTKLQIEQVIVREVEIAKLLLKQNKKKQALVALGKKKYQEQMLERTEEQINNCASLVDQIEFAAVSVKVFEALKLGNNTLQQLNNEMKIEDVEQLMDETKEAIEYQNQVSELLGAKLTEQDDEAIQKQLEDMENDLLNKDLEQLPDVKNVKNIPIQTDQVDNNVKTKPAKEVILT